MDTPREAADTGRWPRERGAVVVQVAVALLGLMALCVFVFDYGILWIARTQAQNAADASALAGAVSLAYEDTADHSLARARAMSVAQDNRVWGRAPTPAELTVTFPNCPPPDSTMTCIRVEVVRLDLPATFAHVVGVQTQRVRATATAEAALANRADCVRPWAVPDKWTEYGELWTPASTYDRYSDGKGGSPPPEPDYYVAPYFPGATGFGWPDHYGGIPRDYGLQLALKPGEPKVSPGWALMLAFTPGGSDYGKYIPGCFPEQSVQIASQEEMCTDKAGNLLAGCVPALTGVDQGNTSHGVDDLISAGSQPDPSAYWDPNANDGLGGVAGSNYATSPRIVPLPVFDTDLFFSRYPTGSGPDSVVKIVNILGFFIEGMCRDVQQAGGRIEAYNQANCDQKTVVGRLMTYPGLRTGTAPPTGASTLRTIMLVR